jgi:hypothetical protein
MQTGGFVKEKRVYQRYTISNEESDAMHADIKIDGKSVSLVDFSLGGLSVLSEKIYNLGDVVAVSASLENRGRIDLIGKVVRVMQAGKSWSVAIDLSHNYKLKSLRKKN